MLRDAGRLEGQCLQTALQNTECWLTHLQLWSSTIIGCVELGSSQDLFRKVTQVVPRAGVPSGELCPAKPVRNPLDCGAEPEGESKEVLGVVEISAVHSSSEMMVFDKPKPE